MSNNILFILEGKRPENSIVKSLTQFFFNENTIVTCAYSTTIYQLYTEIYKDEDLDTFNLLKEMQHNKEVLKNFTRVDFAEIYMFFDYDGHVSNASDKKLEVLLKFFNEETEKGKLYISYPMIEALKHIPSSDTFRDLKISHTQFINYKTIARENQYIDLNHIIKYTLDIWKKLISLHLKKMNFIVNGDFLFPSEIIAQHIIFNQQQEKYINIDQTIGVLSAFPVFLHDYYGHVGLKHKIKHKMKKIYHLSTCSTCKRIINELGGLEDFEKQDIKTSAITATQLEEMKALAGSYESLFSRRAMKYRSMGLADKELNEDDYRNLILEEYTFLKRPVILVDNEIFIGSAKKNIANAKSKIEE